MTLSIRERVLAAFAARLATVPAAGITVYRNRLSAPPSLPALILFDGAQPPPEESTREYGITRYRLTVPLEIHVGAASDDALGPAASEILAQIIEAKSTDITLGGIAEDVIEGAAGELDAARRHEGADCYGVILATYELVFTTPYGKPRG